MFKVIVLLFLIGLVGLEDAIALGVIAIVIWAAYHALKWWTYNVG